MIGCPCTTRQDRRDPMLSGTRQDLSVARPTQLHEEGRCTAQAEDALASLFAAGLHHAEGAGSARNDIVVDGHRDEMNEHVNATQRHKFSLEHGGCASFQCTLRELTHRTRHGKMSAWQLAYRANAPVVRGSPSTGTAPADTTFLPASWRARKKSSPAQRGIPYCSSAEPASTCVALCISEMRISEPPHTHVPEHAMGRGPA